MTTLLLSCDHAPDTEEELFADPRFKRIVFGEVTFALCLDCCVELEDKAGCAAAELRGLHGLAALTTPIGYPEFMAIYEDAGRAQRTPGAFVRVAIRRYCGLPERDGEL